jgi:hypothetical protein
MTWMGNSSWRWIKKEALSNRGFAQNTFKPEEQVLKNQVFSNGCQDSRKVDILA